MFSQYSDTTEHCKENCASPIQLCRIHAIFCVMFSGVRILREHSMIFLHFSLQDYCQEQPKFSVYILPIILQEYCQSYAVTRDAFSKKAPHSHNVKKRRAKIPQKGKVDEGGECGVK